MPKKFLKRFMPANDKFMQSRSMQFINNRVLNASVWHLTRRSASRAALIGLFFAFVPLPMQMVLAAIGCIYARANLPLAIAFVWLTNPLTTAPVFYATYKLGAMIMGLPAQEFDLQFELGSFSEAVNRILQLDFDFFLSFFKKFLSISWQPILLGSILSGIAFGAIGYTLIDLLWRWKTVQRWRKRRVSRIRHS